MAEMVEKTTFLKTLVATRVKEPFGSKVELRLKDKLIATFPAHQTKPKKSDKFVVVNCWKYELVWN